jgi:precorrin-2 dehydrogenase/sirohydrochlorin ferrochelatase
MAQLFPLFLDIDQRECLIVGGGQVARRKAENLLKCNAKVTLVSPRAEQEIMEWAQSGHIKWLAREFRETDLEDVFLVFIATDNHMVTQQEAELCRQKKIMVNAVDDPPNCDFFVPSIIRRKSLVVAISTEGKSPLLAKKLREDLEKYILPEYGEFVEVIGCYREIIKQKVPDIKKRKKILESLVYSDIFDLFVAGEKEKARERIEKCMYSWLD